MGALEMSIRKSKMNTSSVSEKMGTVKISNNKEKGERKK